MSTALTMPIQQLSAVCLNSFRNVDDENEYDMYSEKGFDLLQFGTTEIDVRQYRDWQDDVRQYRDWQDSMIMDDFAHRGLREF